MYLRIIQRLRVALAAHVREKYGEEIAVVLERPPKLELGEAASPVCFELAKRLKKADSLLHEARKAMLEATNKLAEAESKLVEESAAPNLPEEVRQKICESAVRLAKEAAKIPPDAPVRLTVFPLEKDPFQSIYERLLGRDGDEAVAPAVLRCPPQPPA